MEILVDIVILAFLMATAIAVALSRNLFASVMLTGIYSLLAATLFVTMDAVDVAFTEASVGAGISTILMLSTLTLVGQIETLSRQNIRLGLAVVLATGGLLLFGTQDMPAFGDPKAPVQQYLAPYFLNQSYSDIGIPNVVTSILASYRGYDTLGETLVIFTAGIGVLSLLSFGSSPPKFHGPAPMHQHKILRIVSKILIPPILLFALYVQFHGEYSPGGGFQAGVIFAAGIILYAMLFGLETARRVVNQGIVRMLSALGVLLYASVGLVSMLQGKNFLDYSALAPDPVQGQYYGILLVELGVGLTVASVMLIVFFAFAERAGKPARETDA